MQRIFIFLLSLNAWLHLVPAFSVTPQSTVESGSRDVVSRRKLLQSTIASTLSVGILSASTARPVLAAERRSKEQCLYTILRVKEATAQEARLIKSGKFKDVQRANVKLAIGFILDNYRLSDNFVQASAFIDDNSRRVSAGNVGQAAVQNLYTILEYFDASDVQNIKVGSAGMSGKEDLVLKGLETASNNIDEFLSYFPKGEVESVREKILQENELNRKEWDPALGDIVNLPQVV